MKQNNPDKNCAIMLDFSHPSWKEDVRKFGGSITNEQYILQQNDYIEFSKINNYANISVIKLPSTKLCKKYTTTRNAMTIRLKIRFTDFSIVGGYAEKRFMSTLGNGYLTFNEVSLNLISESNPRQKVSVNGEPLIVMNNTNIPLQLNVWYDMFIIWYDYVASTTPTGNNFSIYHLSYGGATPAGYDLAKMDIYKGELTATEIKNLYENKTFQPFTDSSEIFHLNAYNGIINDKMGNRLSYVGTPTIKKIEGINKILCKGNAGITATLNLNNVLSYSFWLNRNFNGVTSILFDGGSFNLVILYGSQTRINHGNANYIAFSANYFKSKLVHIVVTDNNGSLIIYVNGTLLTTDTITPGDISGIKNYRFGYGNTSVETFIGNIRVFNNKILTNQEVSQIYTSEKKLFNIK